MNPWNRIVAHACEHLPDGIVARRAIIESLYAVIPDAEPVREQVAEMLGAVDAHLAAQKELALGIFVGPRPEGRARGSARLGDKRLQR